ncbi:MAG TPA: ATP synthase F0 subunit B, partial [Edaphobacter sp.]
MTLSPMKKLFTSLALATLLLAPACRLRAQEPAATSASGNTSTPEAQSPEKNKQEEDENDAFLHSPSVKAIGAKFGLNPEQAATTFTVLNFVVLAVLVGWFLLKTLPKVFRNRNTAIQKHLVEARTATEEANVRLTSVEARLSKLDEQIAALRAQSEK